MSHILYLQGETLKESVSENIILKRIQQMMSANFDF
jgi:hypothetical protein